MNEKSKQILAKIAKKKANDKAVTAQVIADLKGKTISNLPTKDKDQLLLACCRILGILE